jgi:hypothetical protein
MRVNSRIFRELPAGSFAYVAGQKDGDALRTTDGGVLKLVACMDDDIPDGCVELGGHKDEHGELQAGIG